MGRARRRWIALCAALAAVLTVGASAAAGADEPTLGGGPLRQNSDTAEPGLTSLVVGRAGSGFGPLWSRTLTGTTAATPNQIYAQPLVVSGLGSAAPSGLVVVATEDDQVAALDADTGAPAWQRSLGTGWTPNPTCGDLVPHIGVTSTPVYDPDTRSVYVIAKAAGVDAAHPTIEVHALDVLTGAERPHFPLVVAGRSTNGGRTFDPATSNQRPALLLSHGALYFGTASHCDHGPFVGFIGRVALPTTSTASPTLSLWTTEEDDPNGQAGIWQSGGGLVSDGVDAAGQPRIFFATGNGLGVPPPPGPGTSPPPALSESVVRLAVAADGTMHAADFFSPTTNSRLDQDDSDLGSGGPVALPDSFGSGAHPHLLVIAGKDGVVRLLDRDSLGGVAQGPGGSDAVVDSIRAQGVWGHAAVFDGGDSQRFLYLAPANGPLQAIRVAPDADGSPGLSTAATSSTTYGFGTGSPVVTSDGGDPSTALVWMVAMDGPDGSGSRLVAYPAVPPSTGAWNPVASFPLPTMAKFVQPATDDGRMYLGTRNGQVLAFGAPAPVLQATPTDFGAVAVGASASARVTVNARTATRITGVTVSGAGFGAGPVAATDLPAGGTFSVPVTWTPAAAGPAAGVLTVSTTTSGTAATTALSLRGVGSQAGGTASPAALDLGSVAVGQWTRNGFLVENTGDQPITLTSDATLTGSPQFTFDGVAPPAGTVIAAHESLTVSVRYSPTAATASSATVHLAGSTGGVGGTLDVPVSGTGFTGTPQLTLTEHALDFGSVAPGGTNVASFKVVDTGTSTMQITKAAVPAAPFAVPSPIAEGQQVEPDGTVYAQIFVKPISAMPHTDVYSVSIGATPDGNAPDPGNTPQRVTLSVNTAPWTAPVVGRRGCPVVSGTPRSGAPVVLGSCSSAAARFTRTAGGRYRAGSATSPLCLATRHGGRTAGTVVQLATCAGTSSTTGQSWVIGSQGTLYDAASRLCLRPRQGVARTGTPLDVERCSLSATTEQWDLTGLVAQRGALSSGLAGLGVLCATDRHGSTAAGTVIELSACTLGASQIVAHIGSTLRVAGGCLTRSGSAVVLGRCAGTTAQAWTQDGSGRLVSGASPTRCLAVPGNTTRTGTALAVATCSSATGQRWTLPDRS